MLRRYPSVSICIPLRCLTQGSRGKFDFLPLVPLWLESKKRIFIGPPKPTLLGAWIAAEGCRKTRAKSSPKHWSKPDYASRKDMGLGFRVDRGDPNVDPKILESLILGHRKNCPLF